MVPAAQTVMLYRVIPQQPGFPRRHIGVAAPAPARPRGATEREQQHGRDARLFLPDSRGNSRLVMVAKHPVGCPRNFQRMKGRRIVVLPRRWRAASEPTLLHWHP
jgi:hypothetical protein